MSRETARSREPTDSKQPSVSMADPDAGAAATDAVRRVLESGRLGTGEEVGQFEREVADQCGTARAVGTASGTTALHAALEALGVEPGDAVVTTPFSFVGTANAIRFAGAVPLFADIDPATYTLDPRSVEEYVRAAREDVAALLVAHRYGLAADMQPLSEIAAEYDIPVVEDATRAHGARYDGEHVGSIGDVGCFAFDSAATVPAGNGGMIVTDRNDVADRAAAFVDHGRTEKWYAHETLGHDFGMADVTAAIGRQQLRKLPEYVTARRENAARLTERLDTVAVKTPTEPEDRRHAYNAYTIRSRNRRELRSALADRGVETAVRYPACVDELEAYDGFSATAPAAKRTTETVLSLPVHPGVSMRDIDLIAETIARTEDVYG